MGFPVWNFTKGKYRVRFSDASQDVDRCLALRAEVFRGDAGADDRDAFDARCCHVLIEDASTAALVCCFRILPLANGAALQSKHLYENHIGPEHMRPAPKAAQTVPLNAGGDISCEDGKRALATMPPLLRSYLLMGGWVSDHAVVDHDLDTLHVFTAVEVAAIPEARKRLLRAVRL